uniref:Uncharacterized protein n=1 Tax=Molossus molossus TaxID=27622 RepID=A0A7J8BJJ2_MOLMO|nr:hypothetical protein HJG59_010234 [Molossus molossus]
MTCLSVVYFGHLSRLVSSELSEAVVWWLTEIWRTFQSLLPQILVFLFLSSPGVPLTCVLHCLQSPQCVNILFCYFQSSFLFALQFWKLLLRYLKLGDSLLSHVQWTAEPTKGIFTYVRCFELWRFFLFWTFPSPCLRCQSVLV